MSNQPPLPAPVKANSSRQTKAGLIEREISISADDAFDCITVYAVVFEKKHLKTKCNCDSQCYILERVKCDLGGIAVLVHKQDGQTHHVHLDRIIGDSCSCEAGTYRGACRHLEAVKLALSHELI